MNRVIAFIKKETVLTVAWILALVSAFIIHPDSEYVGYIDFKSLAILWCLMVVVAGLKANGLFEVIGNSCIRHTRYVWQLAGLLVLLPFFFSMLITNDVALLTFVPFALYMLKFSGLEELIIPVVAYQTLAANLGSMMTPVGNPQNLYLYGLSGLNIVEFLKLMLPYTLVSLGLLLVGVLLIKGKNRPVKAGLSSEEAGDEYELYDGVPNASVASASTYVYGVLFLMSVFTVAFPKILDYRILTLIVLVVFTIFNRKVLKSVDYALLLTFVGFFIFTGNLGRIESIKAMMISIVKGHEVMAGVIASQFISNVPAALLLSDFAENIKSLIVGVNLGGLGTLIASMASLISFKLLAHERNELKGRYFVYFTLSNVFFLVVLLLIYVILG